MNHNNSMLVTLLFCILIFTLGCEKATDTEIEEEIEEMFEGHEGKYPGGWTSTTPITSYTNYPISGIFRYSNSDKTKIRAEFFATGNYKSCCDLDNDGIMTFEIVNDSIKNFYFDDKVLDCEGQFRGSGIVAESGNIIIDFTGNDCDGDHVGTLTFRKQ